MSKGLQITRISSLGIWLKAHDKKFFMSYGDYPSFKDKPVTAILNVRETSPGKFYWPDIELKIGMDAIQTTQRSPYL
ncbi:MAG: integron cassette protein [Verrucomicrobiaceae bacterium]|nr:integron cassette protein [Verrucomicrobiaceae bacterium]